MDSETPIVRSFVDSNGEEFVEVVVDPESGSTAGDLPSEAVAGPPKAKEVEIVRSAPRVETNYPAELLLNRKAQPGYRVLPGPRNLGFKTRPRPIERKKLSYADQLLQIYVLCACTLLLKTAEFVTLGRRQRNRTERL